MPQPPISLEKYLGTPLPPVKESFPAGGGATGARAEFTGSLKGISVIHDFEQKVQQYVDGLPKQPLPAHPSDPFPHIFTVSRELGGTVKSSQDIQRYLSHIPLAALSSALTSLKAYENNQDLSLLPPSPSSRTNNRKLDRAGYESDGGEEVEDDEEESAGGNKENGGLNGGQKKPKVDIGKVIVYGWKFSKSPMGSGEFLLVDESKPEDVKLVVRTINSSAFSNSDWEDLVVDGPYHYNTKSRASWYWSRKYGACTRLGCDWFVFTDYQKWCFGVFTEGKEHANISPIVRFDAGANGESISVLEALLYWTRSALGDEKGYKPVVKDVSSLPQPFKDNLARSGSMSRQNRPNPPRSAVKAANESDIEESDAE